MTKDGETVHNIVYTYDELHRLLTVYQGSNDRATHAYDANGNRISLKYATGTLTTYTYDKNNRLTKENKTAGGATTITVYSYDANGNLIQKSNPNGAELYDYNGFNQLTVLKQGGTATTYAYNASGIRTAKRTANGGTYFLLDGGDVVAECADGMLTAIYARGINLISRITAESIEYYLHNAHGDVVALTNDSGTLKKSYDYDAFGNEENPSTSDTNPFRYCGEYFDKETGTYYLRARYYNPAIGRFTQQDSVLSTTRKLANGYEYADPLSLNLYTYCANNPILYCDPSGNAWETVFDVIGIVWSLGDLILNPSLANVGYLLWDIGATLVPFVPGSYTAKVGKYLNKGVDLFILGGKSIDDISDFLRSGGKIGNVIDAIQGTVVGAYRDMKKLVKGTGLEVHHLIEKRFANKLGLNENDILSIAISGSDHQKITNAFRKIIGYNNDKNAQLITRDANANDVWKAVVDVYKGLGMDEYLSLLKEFLLNNKNYNGKITNWRGIE